VTAVAAPDFVYIGPDKAGSSWLHEVLAQHPSVYLSPAKGLYFFDRYYDRGLHWYLRQFADARPEHRVRGEVCTDYLACPESAERMGRDVPGARLMVTLRDPAERAFSSYLHMLRSGWRAGSFLEALTRYPELVEHGRYASQLERFRRWFGREAIHVAVFDDLQADPQSFLDALTSWLGIASLPLDASSREPRLPAGRARSRSLSRTVSWAAHVLRQRDRGELVGRVKNTPWVQRALYTPLVDDRPRLTAEGRARIHAELGDEVARLDDAYGLDLGRRWGWPV
jgi:hypothetical protein